MISAETVREIQKLGTDLRTRLVAGAATQLPTTLYHYTDAAGLMGIVTSGTVWATHYAYLNDASEFKYAVGVMKDVVEKATADAAPGTWKGRFRHVISEDNNPSVYSTDWTQNAGEQQFVACFSERSDSLSQWRGYGKSIGGYSLGFQVADLQASAKRINDSQAGKTSTEANPFITVEFLPCWYNQQKQNALIAEGFERALHHCETTRYPVDDSSLAMLLRAILKPVSSCFKDPAFTDEHEWRLVVRVLRPGLGGVGFGDARERTQDEMRMDQIATVHFRSGEYSLAPYVVLPVVLDAALSLSQVVVGPTPLPENARVAAIQLLFPDREGCPTTTAATARRKIVCTQVTNSTIPFRRV